MQYFERNRFEYHPENAGSRFEVLLGLLGWEALDAQPALLGRPEVGVPDYAGSVTGTTGASTPIAGIARRTGAPTTLPA